MKPYNEVPIGYALKERLVNPLSHPSRVPPVSFPAEQLLPLKAYGRF